MKKVVLEKGRERSLIRKHPWIFSGGIKKVDGNVRSGETVEVVAIDGRFLGIGAWSAESQIRVRIWSFDRKEIIDEQFFRRKIQRALDLRIFHHIDRDSNAYRLVSSEADGLPGLIVDRYNDFLVCQFLSAGVEIWKRTIVEALIELTGIGNVFERSDVDVRNKEGLVPVKGVLNGDPPTDFIEICEHGIKYHVNIVEGHKTGFYLDQRDNRHLVREMSRDAEVLNCFSYTGGFGLSALKGGASQVINVEDSASAIDMIERNMALNGFSSDRCENVQADVFKLLRQYEEAGKKFDVIVLDPPKFAKSQKQLSGALRGYKDINLLAFRLLRSDGLLFSFSCSGLIKMEMFQKVVSDAAADAGREVQVIRWLSQGLDHPVKLAIPESIYLKGLCVHCS